MSDNGIVYATRGKERVRIRFIHWWPERERDWMWSMYGVGIPACFRREASRMKSQYMTYAELQHEDTILGAATFCRKRSKERLIDPDNRMEDMPQRSEGRKEVLKKLAPIIEQQGWQLEFSE